MGGIDLGMKRFYIWTIGCQMNRADSWRASMELRRRGYEPCARAEEADLILLNTCVVRQSAEDKAVGRINSLKSLKTSDPNRVIIVMGCLVGDISQLKRQFPFVDAFLPPSDIAGLVEFVGDLDGAIDRKSLIESHPPVSSFVPISYGCDHHCTYCIVRIRRGHQRSRPVGEIVDEVKCLVERGAVEVTLLGQNVDSYGRDLPDQPDLASVLAAVHEIPGLARIRFLTSNPADMTQHLIETVARLPKVCEHFELPVQSGDDDILRRMARRYTTEEYRRLIEQIRAEIPSASIATDVIVGFPGETEEQFLNTYRLIEEIGFDVVHVAAYSPRPGTPAARLSDDVPDEEKRRRRQAIEALQREIAARINKRYLHRTVEILVEGRQKGKWMGRTRTNKLVFLSSDQPLRGKVVPVRITWTGPWSMQAELIPQAPIALNAVSCYSGNEVAGECQ